MASEADFVEYMVGLYSKFLDAPGRQGEPLGVPEEDACIQSRRELASRTPSLMAARLRLSWSLARTCAAEASLSESWKIWRCVSGRLFSALARRCFSSPRRAASVRRSSSLASNLERSLLLLELLAQPGMQLLHQRQVLVARGGGGALPVSEGGEIPGEPEARVLALQRVVVVLEPLAKAQVSAYLPWSAWWAAWSA